MSLSDEVTDSLIRAERERQQRMQRHRRAIRREAMANRWCTCQDEWKVHAGPNRACTVCPCEGFTSAKRQ